MTGKTPAEIVREALEVELRKILSDVVGLRAEDVRAEVARRLNEFLAVMLPIRAVRVEDVKCSTGGELTFKVFGLENLSVIRDIVNPPFARGQDAYGVVHWTGIFSTASAFRVRCCDYSPATGEVLEWPEARDVPITCVQCLAWEVNRG